MFLLAGTGIFRRQKSHDSTSSRSREKTSVDFVIVSYYIEAGTSVGLLAFDGPDVD